MTRDTLPFEEIVVRMREQWVLLSEEDVRQGLRHREGFLERLRHRHNLGLDEAERQLAEFERRNPSFFFEKSE